MPCAITTGRSEPCFDAVGGYSKLYLFDFIEDAFTVSGGEVTAIDVLVTDVFEYDLQKDANSVEETLNDDRRATGSTAVEQVLTFGLTKQGKETAAELNILAKGTPIAVVKDRMGNYKPYGITDGCILGGSAASGASKGEFNGYNLTLTATETEFAPTFDASTVTAFEALISAVKITP